MPRPVDRDTAYRPGLDGVRALAVALVIGFHLGLPGFQGGLLGVGVFFTLSGYLITGLLLAGWNRRHSWGLNTFWLRRARRLLPAVVMVLITCMTVIVLIDRSDVARRTSEGLAALLYVANWHTIAVGQSYFTQVHGPGPFEHLWSLSVEEQFYLVWPLLLGLLVALARERIRLVAGLTALLAAGSFVLLAVLAHPGMDNTRAYEGTDTRAGGLLVGACVAMVWLQPDGGQSRRLRRPARVALDAAGVAALAGIVWLVTQTNENTVSLYQWGLVLLSVSTALVLAAATHPQTLLSAVLGLRPLRWLGERSYGLYLWHLPVIVFTPEDVLADHPFIRGVGQVAITVALAAASWRFVEDPIRTRGLIAVLKGSTAGLASAGSAPATGHHRPSVVLGASAFVPAAVLLMLLPQVLPRESRVDLAAPPPPAVSAPATRSPNPGVTTGTNSGRNVGAFPPPGSATTDAPRPTTSDAPAASARTSCTAVILVGDSTSEGLYGKGSSLAPGQNLKGQLAKVGVHRFTAEISGARSIIESYENEPSGEQVVRKHVSAGYHGCWIISLGNVDAATVLKYAPDTSSIAARIATVMNTIPKRDPVMWLTTRTIRTDGDFRESAYPPWNQGLVDACARYPNMRVFDWAHAYRTSWIGPDGIHSTATGYEHKARLMARAMALGFPATGPPPSTCVITDGA